MHPKACPPAQEFLTFIFVFSETSGIPQLQFGFFTLVFLFVIVSAVALVIYDFLYLPICVQFGKQKLLRDLSTEGSNRVVDVQFAQFVYTNNMKAK